MKDNEIFKNMKLNMKKVLLLNDGRQTHYDEKKHISPHPMEIPRV